MAKSAWEITTTAFNEIGVHIFIDKAMAILNFPEVSANDIRRGVINFVRLEIRNAKLNEYILSENLLIQRLITLAEIFMTLGHQQSIWAIGLTCFTIYLVLGSSIEFFLGIIPPLKHHK